jgi:hypothetical protein
MCWALSPTAVVLARLTLRLGVLALLVLQVSRLGKLTRARRNQG